MNDFTVLKVLSTSKKSFDGLLTKLSKSEKRYGYQFFQQMVDFFQKTGYDPAEEFESPAAEVKKLRNTLVSFIRKQEKDYIVPLNDKVDHLIKVTAAAVPATETSSNNVQQMPKMDKATDPKVLEKSSDDPVEIQALKKRIAELEEERVGLLEKQASMIKLYRKIGNSLEKTSTGMDVEWVIFNFSRQDHQTILNYVREDP